jgi:hypothetical protein
MKQQKHPLLQSLKKIDFMVNLAILVSKKYKKPRIPLKKN